MKRLAAVVAGLSLAACAPTWDYIAPPNTSKEDMDTTRSMCEEESGMQRLGEEKERLEQQCMIERGYRVKPKG